MRRIIRQIIQTDNNSEDPILPPSHSGCEGDLSNNSASQRSVCFDTNPSAQDEKDSVPTDNLDLIDDKENLEESVYPKMAKELPSRWLPMVGDEQLSSARSFNSVSYHTNAGEKMDQEESPVGDENEEEGGIEMSASRNAVSVNPNQAASTNNRQGAYAIQGHTVERLSSAMLSTWAATTSRSLQTGEEQVSVRSSEHRQNSLEQVNTVSAVLVDPSSDDLDARVRNILMERTTTAQAVQQIESADGHESIDDDEELILCNRRRALVIAILLVVAVVIGLAVSLTSRGQSDTAATLAVWPQYGQAISGTAGGDRFGFAVALSNNGNNMAVGAIFNVNHGVKTGHVRVYHYNSDFTRWEKRGSIISGNGTSDFGWAVALDGTANVLCVSGPRNDMNGFDSGVVKVYQFDTGTDVWLPMGQAIYGTHKAGRFGFFVALSRNGYILAASAIREDRNGRESGLVQVYEYNTTSLSWVQMGQDLNGDANGDEFGRQVALSNDGLILAATSIMNGENTGHVKVYQYNHTTLTWEQMGQTINGKVAGEEFGFSVSLSSNGLLVASGAVHGGNARAGQARVYGYDTNTSSWLQMGQDIDGEATGEWFGWSLSVSSAGDTVAVGAPSPDDEDAVGHVRLFQFNSAMMEWKQVAQTLAGEDPGDEFGFAVSLSSLGNVVAIGAPGHGQDSGIARAHKVN